MMLRGNEVKMSTIALEKKARNFEGKCNAIKREH